LKLVGAESKGGDLTEVGVDEITGGISENDFESSWIKRFKARHPWWKGSLDLGWNLEETAIDKIKIAAGLSIERRRKPTRFVGDVRYAYEAQGPKDEEKQTTKDEFRGFLLGEYDLSRKWFCFVDPAGEFDKIRGVDVRLYPSLGVGYRFVETERSLLQVQAGPGYVYEEFINFGRNDYFAAQVGVEARHRFGKYLNCGLRLFYMPGIPDYRHDWLFRTELDVGVPITEFLSMKLNFTEVSDNNPTPDVGGNKLTTTLGLAVTF